MTLLWFVREIQPHHQPHKAELGLNYSWPHLVGDQDKLASSQVRRLCPIHLSRVAPAHHDSTEAYIKGIADRPKIAYVRHHLDGRLVHTRKLGHPEIIIEQR